MAIKTKDELMTDIQTFLGDDTSDAALALVQDLSDTLGNDASQQVADLQRKLDEQDKAWRKRYRDTFFSGKPDEDDKPPEPEKPRTFADLFKTE